MNDKESLLSYSTETLYRAELSLKTHVLKDMLTQHYPTINLSHHSVPIKTMYFLNSVHLHIHKKTKLITKSDSGNMQFGQLIYESPELKHIEYIKKVFQMIESNTSIVLEGLAHNSFSDWENWTPQFFKKLQLKQKLDKSLISNTKKTTMKKL